MPSKLGHIRDEITARDADPFGSIRVPYLLDELLDPDIIVKFARNSVKKLEYHLEHLFTTFFQCFGAGTAGTGMH
jgi:hypothetical protein